MNPIQLFLILITLLFLSACSTAPDNWQTFYSKEGNFSVNVPGMLVETATTDETPLGPIHSHIFSLHRGTYGYKVVYTDYPIPGIAKANELGALEGGVVRTLDSVNAGLTAKQDILLGSAPGIEFRGEIHGGLRSDPPQILFARVYLSDARLYQISIIADEEYVTSADSARFLTSFQFIAPAKLSPQ